MPKSNLVHAPKAANLRELSALEIEDVAGGPFWFWFGIGMLAGEVIHQAMTDA